MPGAEILVLLKLRRRVAESRVGLHEMGEYLGDFEIEGVISR